MIIILNNVDHAPVLLNSLSIYTQIIFAIISMDRHSTPVTYVTIYDVPRSLGNVNIAIDVFFNQLHR